jgi:hypothetical protein
MMRRVHVRRVGSALAIALALVALPAGARAHQGGQPFLHVPVDHIVPGESFPVVAADLGPDSTVTIEVAAVDGVVLLGTVTAGPDGHFETVLVMPSTVGEGYFEISARGDDGSVASTWVRIGAAGESTPSTRGSTGRDFWIDPSLLLLLAGVAVAGAAWFIRSRRAKSSVGPTG